MLPLNTTLQIVLMKTSFFHRSLSQDILNISVQGIAVTAQMWPEKTTVSVMVRTFEAVDLCTPGSRFPRILASWVLYCHLGGIFEYSGSTVC